MLNLPEFEAIKKSKFQQVYDELNTKLFSGEL